MSSVSHFAARLVRIVGPLLIVAAGVAIARAMILAREAPPTTERPERAAQVAVHTVELVDLEPTLPTFGVVEARRSVSVRATVGGPILEVHPDLIAGGRIAEGEALLVLDPRDFELAVAQAEADLLTARANLDVELGNAAVAEAEWALMDGRIETDEEGERLAKREPFVARERASVANAEARLERAKLDLERSVIRTPFDAVVVSEDVEVGGLASVGSELARLVDAGEFLVVVSLPTGRLDELSTGRRTTAVRRVGSEPGASRTGRLERVLGEVDAAGRMARVQVAVEAPLASEAGAPLLLGDYVRVELPGRALSEVAIVSRRALHEGDTVWIADADDRLEIRPVEVHLRREADVIVTEGLHGGDRLVLDSIGVPLPGMRLAPSEAGEGSDVEAGGTVQ